MRGSAGAASLRDIQRMSCVCTLILLRFRRCNLTNHGKILSKEPPPPGKARPWSRPNGDSGHLIRHDYGARHREWVSFAGETATHCWCTSRRLTGHGGREGPLLPTASLMLSRDREGGIRGLDSVYGIPFTNGKRPP